MPIPRRNRLANPRLPGLLFLGTVVSHPCSVTLPPFRKPNLFDMFLDETRLESCYDDGQGVHGPPLEACFRLSFVTTAPASVSVGGSERGEPRPHAAVCSLHAVRRFWSRSVYEKTLFSSSSLRPARNTTTAHHDASLTDTLYWPDPVGIALPGRSPWDCRRLGVERDQGGCSKVIFSSVHIRGAVTASVARTGDASGRWAGPKHDPRRNDGDCWAGYVVARLASRGASAAVCLTVWCSVCATPTCKHAR
jgi:hypothetical protein